jgi:outer membrane biosynthesis protein TonB
MAEEKKYHDYTAEDIVKYHKGLLSATEMHELEKAALDDPFLADAIEGYGDMNINPSADLELLKRKLEERVAATKVIALHSTKNSFIWLKVAAAAVIVGGIGFISYKFIANNSKDSVAKLETGKTNSQKVSPAADSSKLKITTPEKEIVVNNNELSAKTKSPQKEKTSVESFSFSNGVSTNADTLSDKMEALAKSVSVPSSSTTTEKKYDSMSADQKESFTALSLEKSKKAEVKKDDQSNRIVTNNEISNNRTVQQQKNYFRGQVLDVNKNPMPFANITNPRDNAGIYSDANGNFTITSSDSVLNIQVRSVGYTNNNAQLRNDVAVNKVIMQEDKTGLPETIVSRKAVNANRSREGNVKIEESGPADGWSNYDTYIANNISTPDEVKSGKTNGMVEVSFDINKHGKPVNLKIEKSLCAPCDEEAVRLIKNGPKWKKSEKKSKRIIVGVPFE